MDGSGRPRRRPPPLHPLGPMTVVAPKHVRRAVLGAALILALAASVYAASRGPAIEVVGAPLARSAAPGTTATFKVTVERRGGFNRRVAIYVRGLPPGTRAVWRLPSAATLPRAYRRGPTVILPARRRTAILTVRVPAGARPRTYRPLLRAYGRRVRDTARLRLEIRPGSVVRTAPAPAFAIASAVPGRSVLQGDEASWDITIERRGGFAEPVAMAVDGLPPGARDSWSDGGLAAGDRVTMSVAADRTTPTGSYELTIRGTAGGTTETAVATLDVLETKPFGIAGGTTTPVRPGGGVPLDLHLSNPYDFPLRVERIDVAVAEETSNPGCSGSANYRVEPATGLPVVLEPGTTPLADAVPAHALPRLVMRETGADQDACRGARVQLRYEGVAGR